MDKKRILLIIAFIAVAALIAFGLFYFFFRGAPTPPAAPPVTAPPIGVLPPAAPAAPQAPVVTPPVAPGLPQATSVARGGLTETNVITSAATQNATLAADGTSMQYWNKTDGKFYRITPDGLVKQMSGETFYSVQNVTWSPDKNRAVLEYPDGSKIIYNFNTQKQVTIPRFWQDFSFSPQSDKIVSKSIGVDPNNRWLVISGADGTGTKAVEPLGENADKVTVNWSPNGQMIAFSHTGDYQGFARQEVIPIGQNHENFKSFTVEGLGFTPLWSPEGDKLIYSVYNADSGYRPTLWATTASTDSFSARKPLGLNTWADKCAIKNDVAYCAVPTSLDEGAGFERTIADETPDVFYKIDLTTGTKTLLAIPTADASATNVQVSADGQYLFYTGKLDGVLYKIRLK
jgi:WD40 repeat protein